MGQFGGEKSGKNSIALPVIQSVIIDVLAEFNGPMLHTAACSKTVLCIYLNVDQNEPSGSLKLQSYPVKFGKTLILNIHRIFKKGKICFHFWTAAFAQILRKKFMHVFNISNWSIYSSLIRFVRQIWLTNTPPKVQVIYLKRIKVF